MRRARVTLNGSHTHYGKSMVIMLIYHDGVEPYDWFQIIFNCRPLARRDKNNILLNCNQSNNVDVILVCNALQDVFISFCVYVLCGEWVVEISCVQLVVVLQ